MIVINPRISAKGGEWDDLRFPAQGINPPGAASDMTVESTTGLLLAANSVTRLVAGVAQLPHEWLEQSTVRPHVHWQKTADGAGDVLWRFEYDLVNNGEVAPYTYANVLDITDSVAGTPDNDTQDETLISAFGDVSMVGMRASSLIFWKLSRIGGDASDTYGNTARMVEFDVHHLKDSNGSKGEFIKYKF